MKKIAAVITIIFLLSNYSILTVSAEELQFDFSGVYESLSDEAAGYLNGLGIRGADADALASLSFEEVMAQICDIAGDSLASPLRGLVTVLAVLIMSAMLSAYKTGLSDDISATAQAAAALCVSAAVAAPAISFINTAGGIILNSANLFLAYIPVAAVMIAASGKGVSAASFQASMIAAGQGVARVCSDIILPLMNIFLGLSITSGISPEARLTGVTSMASKLAKWLLAFVMTVFTAVLSIRQFASNALDSVAVRTARFALSSFVPVVGGALSEAYRSVQGSLTALKSGLGIFVILGIAFTFLPAVIQGLGWSLSLFVGKAAAEVMGVDGCARLLDSLSAVFSTLIAVLLCVMSVFIISTAAAFTIGSDV